MSMYEITEETSSGSAIMKPGINENVKIVDICRENSKNDGTGTEVLAFHFKDATGNTFTHKEFPIDEQREKEMAAKYNNDPAERVKQAFNDMGARIKHILSAFMPASEVLIKGAKGWEDYCDKVVALAGNTYQDQVFRIKVILNKKDYNTFPKKTASPFVENMEEKSSMWINPKYDRVVPMAPASQDQFGDGLDDEIGVGADDKDEFEEF